MRWLAIAFVFLAGCTQSVAEIPQAEDFEVVDLAAPGPEYEFELRVNPHQQGRFIDFLVSHNGRPIDIVNHETGNQTVSLSKYILGEGEVTVSVHENSERYLVANVELNECTRLKANAILEVHKRTPARHGLSMEYGCVR